MVRFSHFRANRYLRGGNRAHCAARSPTQTPLPMPKHRRQHPEVAPVWRRFFSLAPWHQQRAPGRAYTPTAAQREWCTHAMRLRLYYMLVGADGRVRRPAPPARRGRQVHLVPVRLTRIAHALLQEWEPAAGQQTDPLAEAQQVLQSLVRWVEVEPPRSRRFAARCQPTARYAVVYLPAFGPRGRIPYLTPRARTQLELWVGRLAWRDYYWRATHAASPRALAVAMLRAADYPDDLDAPSYMAHAWRAMAAQLPPAPESDSATKN